MNASNDRISAGLGLFVAISLSVAGCAIAPAGEPEPIEAAALAQVSAEPALAAEILRLTNVERQLQGIPPLQEDTCLDYAAQAHAMNVANTGNTSHDLYGLGAPDRMHRTGYRGESAWGENMHNAWSTADIGVVYPAQAIQWWLSSPAHRTDLLRPTYTHVGVGVAKVVHNGVVNYYAVQNFGADGTCQLDLAGYAGLLH